MSSQLLASDILNFASAEKRADPTSFDTVVIYNRQFEELKKAAAQSLPVGKSERPSSRQRIIKRKEIKVVGPPGLEPGTSGL